MLLDYVRGRHLTFTEFAELIGTRYQIVQAWISGDAAPNIQYAIKIEKLTKGQVPCTAWEKLDSAESLDGL